MTFFKMTLFSRGDSAEKRRTKRISYRCPVDFTVGHEKYERFSRTLSSGGLYIATPYDFPPKTIIHMRIAIGNNGKSIPAQGSVIYNISGQGMGVKFLQIRHEDQRKIEAVVEKSWWQEV